MLLRTNLDKLQDLLLVSVGGQSQDVWACSALVALVAAAVAIMHSCRAAALDAQNALVMHSSTLLWICGVAWQEAFVLQVLPSAME